MHDDITTCIHMLVHTSSCKKQMQQQHNTVLQVLPIHAANLVHDVSGEVSVAEGDDAIFDQAPALVKILA